MLAAGGEQDLTQDADGVLDEVGVGEQYEAGVVVASDVPPV